MKMSNVQILRLTSGEELIGRVDFHDEEGYYAISKAYILIPMGQGQIGFAPYMPYTRAEDGFTISEEHVMFMIRPMSEMETQYTSAVSGLVTAPAGANKILGSGLKLTN
jgi:hypothetical protein